MPSKYTPFVSILVFGVLANIPFWIAGDSFGLIQKGIFNLELLLIGLLSLFLPRVASAMLLLLAIVLDLFSGVSLTFLFTAPETLYAMRWFSEFAPAHRLPLLALIAFTLLAVLCATRLPRLAGQSRHWTAFSFAWLLVLFVAHDLATGKAPSWGADRQWGTLRLSRTPLRSLWIVDVRERAQRALRYRPRPAWTAVSRSSLQLASFSQASTPSTSLPNVVLILAESWGQPTDPVFQKALLEPFSDPALQDQFVVRNGTTVFEGSTINGEARELCGVGQGLSLVGASSTEFHDCLPAKMKQRGYRTLAVHGFTGRMYGRRDWWKTIGFDEQWFQEQLAPQAMPLCAGPLPGICDTSIAHWMGDRLQQPSDAPSFLYWVTLNSHLPVPIPNRLAHPESCAALSPTRESPALCSWFQLIVNLHRSIAALALRPSVRPTVFLIVGDHQPPFSSLYLRNQFSDREVPYVLLTPRDLGDIAPPPKTLAGHHASPARKIRGRSRKVLAREDAG